MQDLNRTGNTKEDFMSQDARHIAVLDVGRTNKKLLIYDLNLNQVDSVFATIDDVAHGTENHEPVEAVTGFFLDSLSEMGKRYNITAISISTYGGTFVCLDENGSLAVPALSGSTDPGEAFHADFDASVGDPRDIQRRMATPRMPYLSVIARGIYYVKTHYPEGFARTRKILGLPQYYGYLLTGKTGMDITYAGTHTALWDFEQMRFSEVRNLLGVQEMIPSVVSNSWDILGTLTPEIARQTGLSTDVVVTMGVHDSNAAMVPFLIREPKDFVMVSTGSMCVVMHPVPEPRLAEDEIGEMVYFNLDGFGGVFKTALFVAGLEFDLYMGFLEGSHGRRDHPDFNPALIGNILKQNNEFILPAIVPFGMYMHSPARFVEGDKTFTLEQVFMGQGPGFVKDYERTYNILMLSMALHTRKAMLRAGITPGRTAIIAGGFSHNTLFTHLIASMFPDAPVICTDLNEASALGAAILGLAALEGVSPKMLAGRFSTHPERIPATPFAGLEDYVATFERYMEKPR